MQPLWHRRRRQGRKGPRWRGVAARRPATARGSATCGGGGRTEMTGTAGRREGQRQQGGAARRPATAQGSMTSRDVRLGRMDRDDGKCATARGAAWRRPMQRSGDRLDRRRQGRSEPVRSGGNAVEGNARAEEDTRCGGRAGGQRWRTRAMAGGSVRDGVVARWASD